MKKYQLMHHEPPIQRLNYAIGDCVVYMKRDDLIDFAGGGNKVRLFEYILPEIVESRASKIVTFGSVHSNHIRVASIVAEYLGIQCDIILLHEEGNEEAVVCLSPNLKMIGSCRNTSIVHCKSDEAHDFIDDYLSKQIEYYWIPGGGHTTSALNGYAGVARELLDYTVGFDAVFLPCGTGTTQAGMIYGMNEKVPIYGVTVARSVDRCILSIKDLLKSGGYKTKDGEINVLPCETPYGVVDKEIESIVSQLLKSDGICLDPVYNAKAFSEMVKFIRIHTEIKSVLYVNTGGQPNIFM